MARGRRSETFVAWLDQKSVLPPETEKPDAGIDPKPVSDRMGHAHMAYTLSIYDHPSTGKDRDAAERVAGMLGWACARWRGTPPETSCAGRATPTTREPRACPVRRDPRLKTARRVLSSLGYILRTTDAKGAIPCPKSAPDLGSGGRI